MALPGNILSTRCQNWHDFLWIMLILPAIHHSTVLQPPWHLQSWAWFAPPNIQRACTTGTNATQVERNESEHEYPAENARLLLTSHHAIPLGTALNRSFPVWSKTIKSWSCFNSAHAFKSSEPRLQHPRSRSTTNFVYHRNAIVPFFYARSHSLSPGCQAQLSMNQISDCIHKSARSFSPG